ncbi:MAG: transcription-repair coupling factor [Anaerolineales bacterium]
MSTDLTPLLEMIRAQPSYQDLLARLRAPRDRRLDGFRTLALALPRSAQPAVLASLVRDIPVPFVLALSRSDEVFALRDEISTWDRTLPVEVFGEPSPLSYEPAPWGPRTVRERISTLSALAEHSIPSLGTQPPLLVLTSLRAWMTPTLPRQDFVGNSRRIVPGAKASLDELLRFAVDLGYQSQPYVMGPGQFSRRGGIIDLWPPADPQPARIEFFGETIETLRHFDPGTQRSTDGFPSLSITPACEALDREVKRLQGQGTGPRAAPPGREPEEDELGPESRPSVEFFIPWLYPPTDLLDHLSPEGIVLAEDYEELEATAGDLEEQTLQLRAEALDQGEIHAEDPAAALSWDHLQESLELHRLVELGRQAADADLVPLGEAFAPGPRFGGQIGPLIDHLERAHRARSRTLVVSRQAARLVEIWGDRGNVVPPASEVLTQMPAEGAAVFIQGALQEGFVLQCPAGGGPARALEILTDGEIFGWARPEPRRRIRVGATPPEAEYADLNAGDYVVHVEYGIGRFDGLVHRTVEDSLREYLQVEFAGGDQVYVPVHQADRLTRYVGADDRPPTLSRLGSADWATAREKARKAVEEIARELLDLYAKRQTALGHSFGLDTAWQSELEASFPFVETEDQLRAIEEVKRDMERARPMDRLICGDVGYGKTEVALRAAFKAVMDGKQVAVLVPTTLLAQQHFETFRQRLAPFPVQVEMLSRFRSPGEQTSVLADLAEGRVEIIIGTHRLLQADVRFKDLGLVVIDEEQRFGVAHKEHLKQLRTEVDVLTLTATPIPRTLYLSLTGVRDISTINTPPEDRLPVVTQVRRYSESVARKAILRELDRGGQVFWVHNRVETIGVAQKKLAALVPEAHIALAHGQMPEIQLERSMQAFISREADVLLCTSIIESGLDIPNANTLIVERADTFGLAQLYQLRGRVGRSAMRGYAYFFSDHRHRLTDEARERLRTMADQTDLGAGYGVAMRDLEIRGAGEILGSRQHGHIAAIGFHLYTRLLTQAVRRLKEQREGGPQALPVSLASVDLPLNVALPPDYIEDRGLRLRLYRRMAEIQEESELEALAEELKDRFGTPPLAVDNLLYQLRVKLLAQKAGVESVTVENGSLALRLAGSAEEQMTELPASVRFSRGSLYMQALPSGDEWRDRLTYLLRWLAQHRTSAELSRTAEPAPSLPVLEPSAQD